MVNTRLPHVSPCVLYPFAQLCTLCPDPIIYKLTHLREPALGPVWIESYLQLLLFSFQLFGYSAIGPFWHRRSRLEFELFF